MALVSFVTPLHISSKRNYLERMTAEKPHCMRIAKEFGADYWDGDRKYGYGGYKYDGRWKSVAEAMVEYYGLNSHNNILDIGCGKGHLLYEFSNIFPEINICGSDISEYVVDNAKRTLQSCWFEESCIDIGIPNNQVDFTYSINVFHNLNYRDLKQALHEMVRVTKPDGNSYICVESYRNEEELTNLQCWQLTCLSYYSPDDWLQIYEDCGYKGDCEFIFFE